jgi:Na+-driven multidrug efflux pump
MKKHIDMLEGSAIKTIIRFALPIMFSSLLQYNYALVDNIIGADT